MLRLVAFFPHPPIAVQGVGGTETAKAAATANAMHKLALSIKNYDPEVIVVITPHGHVFSDAVTITAIDPLEGNLGNFGAPQVSVTYNLDREAVQAIVDSCGGRDIYCAALNENDLKSYKLKPQLDHGQVVPLSFVAASGWQGNLVPINMAYLPYEELYEFGSVLRDAMDSLHRNWVLLVSGDLSHRLLPQAPAGYSPQGAVFDEIIRQCIREGDVRRAINLEPALIEEAGECGLRPLIMALGTLDGYEVISKELSYEGPFGVGYLVAEMKPGREMPQRRLSADLYEERSNKLKREMAKEGPLVKLARKSIEHYLKAGSVPDVPGDIKNSLSPDESALFAKKAGVFVSLKKHGQLRGCIGTIAPTQTDLAQEVIQNAVSAAMNDHRFPPLEAHELEELTISVDVLGKPERVKSNQDLNPQKYGVIVSKGNRKGLLLPDLPGIDSAQEQIRIAKQKAGLSPDEEVELQRFQVIRYY